MTVIKEYVGTGKMVGTGFPHKLVCYSGSVRRFKWAGIYGSLGLVLREFWASF